MEPTTPFTEFEKNLRRQVGKLYTGGYVTDLRLWVCPSDKIDFNGKAVTVAKADSITNNTFNSVGNCSYMYISGFNLIRTSEQPVVSPMFCDESNDREWGPVGASYGMPTLKAEDNHGANTRNVLFLDGHVVTINDANVANGIFSNLVAATSICSVD